MNKFNKVNNAVEDSFEWIKSVRRELHMYPEDGMKEFRTADIICLKLDELGIPYKRNIANTGIVGFIEAENPRGTIALRADMDGLPVLEENDVDYVSRNRGFMHACGHDAHVAIQLGTAKVLKHGFTDMPYNVKLIFQPAEESIGGALPMIKEGVLENPKVDCIFGLHVEDTEDVGTVSVKYGVSQAAVDTFTIHIKGRGAHGAHPVDGVDAILIAAHVVTAIQSIVSRNVDAHESVVISIGKIAGGTKENIVADSVIMEGTMRTLSEEVRNYAAERLEEVVKSTAKAFGGTGEIDIRSEYCCLDNDNSVVSYVKDNAVKLLGGENVITAVEPSMGGEDFAFFLKSIKGAFFKIGTRNIESGISSPAHSSTFNIDENALKIGTAMQVLNILRYEKIDE